MDKKNFFLKAIQSIRHKQEIPEPQITEEVKMEKPKTLQERARDRLREIGVDRGDGSAVFGDRKRNFQPEYSPLNLSFNQVKKFEEAEQAKYMSDTNNWLLVHATNYMPQNNSIQTTAHARNWSFPRSTVHFTLNHIVTAHIAGNWDDRPIVILAPYKDTVAANQQPAQVSLFDTFFSPDVDSGLKLPQSAHIVHPSDKIPDGLLFQIKNNETLYKADNYTDEEIQEILTLMPEKDRVRYHELEQGILSDTELSELEYINSNDKKFKKAYDSAKDKKAFLAGIMAEERYQILIHFVRNLATKMSIERMGYQGINMTIDGSDVARAVADSAISSGAKSASAGNKGHHTSLYNSVEDVYSTISYIQDLLQNYVDDPDYVSDALRFYISGNYMNLTTKIISNIADNKQTITAQDTYNIFQRTLESQKEYFPFENYAEYDKNLDTTIRKYCEYVPVEIQQTLLKIRKHPGFVKLQNKLRSEYADIIPNNLTMQNTYSNDR